MPWKVYVQTYFHILLAHGLSPLGKAIFLLKCKCSGQGIRHTWVLPGIYTSVWTNDLVLCNLSGLKEEKVD